MRLDSCKTNEKGHGIRRQLEIDFVCSKGAGRRYIQPSMRFRTKMEQEQCSPMLTGDFFEKILIAKDLRVPYYNGNGGGMRVYDFLLNEGSPDRGLTNLL